MHNWNLEKIIIIMVRIKNIYNNNNKQIIEWCRKILGTKQIYDRPIANFCQ